MTNASLEIDAAAVQAAVARARSGLVDREVLTEVVALCAVAGEHLLVIGPPGTAKSEAVRRVSAQIGGQYFEYLLGRFTEPNEVFGPINLQRLREGVVEVETAGMLPEAEIAFIDEVFLGSTAILNTLLGILNERTFRRGSTAINSPLRVCVGAANRLPEDPALDAFADRFLTRIFIDSVPDARLEEMLEVGWAGDFAAAPGESLMPAIARLSDAARQCDLSGAQPLLAIAVRRLRAAGILLSDRRIVRTQRLIAAAAVLDGRMAANEADLWVLPLVTPTPDDQVIARETLGDLLAKAHNASARHAAEEFSRGSLARAARMAAQGNEQLAALGQDSANADLRLRAEATLREIDAVFGADQLGDELARRSDIAGGSSPGASSTMTFTGFALTFDERKPPLEPAAVLARGAAETDLRRSAARRADAGAELFAAAGAGWLVVLAAPDSLPWADGCIYLGWDNGILVPTTLRTVPSADLIRDAIKLKTPVQQGLRIVTPDGILTAERPTSAITPAMISGDGPR